MHFCHQPMTFGMSATRFVLVLASVSNAAALRLAEQHFSRVVSRAHASVERTHPVELPITPSYLIGTLAFNCAAHLVAAHEMSAFLSR